jgi:hypothetical protein
LDVSLLESSKGSSVGEVESGGGSSNSDFDGDSVDEEDKFEVVCNLNMKILQYKLITTPIDKPMTKNTR